MAGGGGEKKGFRSCIFEALEQGGIARDEKLHFWCVRTYLKFNGSVLFGFFLLL